jgi:hypothetical protein
MQESHSPECTPTVPGQASSSKRYEVFFFKEIVAQCRQVDKSLRLFLPIHRLYCLTQAHRRGLDVDGSAVAHPIHAAGYGPVGVIRCTSRLPVNLFLPSSHCTTGAFHRQVIQPAEEGFCQSGADRVPLSPLSVLVQTLHQEFVQALQ